MDTLVAHVEDGIKRMELGELLEVCCSGFGSKLRELVIDTGSMGEFFER